MIKKCNNKGKNNPMYGRKHSEETKRKISESKKGNTPWNKGLTKETSEILQLVSIKISDTVKKTHLSKTDPERWKAQCKKCSEFMMGENNPMYENTHTKEARKKISEALTGNAGYWKGKKLSLETRKKLSEGMKDRFVGGNHWNWKGGISFEPYCHLWTDKEYKESIKERDGYKCLNPECSGQHTLLHLHHINYDKKDCRPNNIITLCVSCNSKANHNRDWHQSWYESIIYQRYKIK